MNSDKAIPKVAIVCDWLAGGGSERVIVELHNLYPAAPLYMAYCSDQSRQALGDADLHVSYMQRYPFSKLYKFLPLMRQLWFHRLKLQGYDIVISVGSAEAKGIRVPMGTVHINYCYTPTHYYWIRYEEYLRSPGFGGFLNPIARLGLKLLLKPARRWDYKAAQRPDVMIAISSVVQHRIQTYYHRDSLLIHPPVDTSRFRPTAQQRRVGFVVAGRQTPYKRIDLAVQACTMANLPLKVIGNGPDHERLVKMAGPTIEFLTNLPDEDMPKHFQSAEAFIFPNEDDFGIVLVEAMAAGTPVIAYRAGGALDTVVEGKTGLFFDEQIPKNLADTLRRFDSSKFDHQEIVAHARNFDSQVFKSQMQAMVLKALKKYTTPKE